MSKKKTEKDVIKIGVIYARYSSAAQKDASIEQQVEECQKFARVQGIEVIETYADRAVSGKTDRRPAFQRMMRDAEKHKFKYVLAWKSNRIGRNMLQAKMNEAKLESCGVKCLYAEESFDDTAAGRFALRSMMNVNQFYIENMAEDIRRGMRDNAMNCKVTNGVLPLGYKKTPDLHYEIDEAGANVVREIFERVAAGEPFQWIYDDLNARGIKTARGTIWKKNSLARLITNERYRGIYIWSDVRIEGGIPRIIDDELFFKVQEVLKTKNNPRGRKSESGLYLLTGKLFCGKCKAPMVGVSGTGCNGTLYSYYTCQSRRLRHTCDKDNVGKEYIEETVARAIKEYVLKPEIIEWIADETIAYNEKHEELPYLRSLQDEILSTDTAIRNLMKAVERGIISDSLQRRLSELEVAKYQAQQKLFAAKADIIPVTREEVIEGLSKLRDGDIYDEKYMGVLFDTFLVAAYLYDDHIDIGFSFTGDKNKLTMPIDDIEEKFSYKGISGA